MSEIKTETTEQNQFQGKKPSADSDQLYYYRVRFRENGQEFTIQAPLQHLSNRETIIVKTDHGPEPAKIVCRAPSAQEPDMKRRVSFVATRRANREEDEKYSRIPELEQEAFNTCVSEIKRLDLPMHLIRVERFFNGSKIIFYFTADSRVDFRELVKSLVQEFRTRVEMRQIGVRHETQITGGIGPCGRELCCSSFLKKFESVSIKMAKTQDLPLNPAKISGLCNRLLCCLTYEYDSYRAIKKGMPRIGKTIVYEKTPYRVIRQMTLQGCIMAVSKNGEEIVLTEEQWRTAGSAQKGSTRGQATKK